MIASAALIMGSTTIATTLGKLAVARHRVLPVPLPLIVCLLPERHWAEAGVLNRRGREVPHALCAMGESSWHARLVTVRVLRPRSSLVTANDAKGWPLYRGRSD